MEIENNTNTQSPVVEDWRVLVALANDDKFNYELLESEWYGLWDYVLQKFREVKNCYVFPQMSIWAAQIFEGASMIRQPPSTPGRSSQLTSPPNSPNFIRSSILAKSSPVPKKLSVNHDASSSRNAGGDESFDKIPPDMEGISWEILGVESGKVWQKKKEGEFLAFDAFEAGDEDEDFSSSSGYAVPGTHKIPDFSIVHVTYRLSPNSPPAFVSIKGKTVPILVEIKRNEDFRANNVLNANNVEGQMITLQAALGLRRQAKYLFSAKRQLTVVCIAATGHYWLWQRFVNKDGDPVPKYKKGKGKMHSLPKSDPFYEVRYWNGVYEIGTQRSDEMLIRICDWVQKFVDNPKDNDKFDIDDEI